MNACLPPQSSVEAKKLTILCWGKEVDSYLCIEYSTAFNKWERKWQMNRNYLWKKYSKWKVRRITTNNSNKVLVITTETTEKKCWVFNCCQLFQSGSVILKRLISRETRQDWPLFDILFIFLITNINGLFDMVIFSLRTNMLNNLANTGDTDLIILRKSKSVELLFLSKVQTLKSVMLAQRNTSVSLSTPKLKKKSPVIVRMETL